jgi:hypothetical protein
VGLSGASVRGRGAVALQHRAGPPPGQAHQVGLSPALGEPLVGEGVTELVRVQVGQAGLATTTPQHLHQPPGRQPTKEPEPQPREGRVLVAGSHPEVPVQRDRSGVPEGQGPLPTALAKNQSDIQVEVQVGEAQIRDLARRAPVSSRKVINAVSRRASKLLPAQAASSRRSASSGTTGTGLSGTIGGFMRAIGLIAISSSSSSQRYSACSCL